VVAGCSVDRTELYSPKSKNVLEKTSSSSNSEIISEDYGMPFDDQYLLETRLIKIIYNIDNRDAKYDIRSKYSRKYPTLFLVKVATERDPIEYWFLSSDKIVNTGSDAIPDYEEDEDVNNTHDSYRSLIEEIKGDPYISLQE